MKETPLDEVGYWTEIKLDIVREYAKAYTKLMVTQPNIRRYVYIDAFAGAGVHVSKRTGEFISGSPLNALLVSPPFSEYHFIDLDGSRVDSLREMTRDNRKATVH
ncbi:MAG: three-Cys-motif partner protein TcmP, partial [Solirubrobacterales bacterium]